MLDERQVTHTYLVARCDECQRCGPEASDVKGVLSQLHSARWHHVTSDGGEHHYCPMCWNAAMFGDRCTCKSESGNAE